MQKNERISLIAAVLLAAFAFSATGCGKPKDGGGPPQGKGAPPEVSVVEIKSEQVAITTELSGRTSAFLIAEVRPQVGGIIQKRLFTEGAEVKEGDVLYQIDPALFKAAYESAKAALAKAEANVPPARYKAERYKELVAARAISKQEFDEADSAFKKAEADVEASKAEMEKARINLEYSSIKAPISGRIGRSSVTTGALVTANQATALATIQKLDQVYVDVTQTSASLLRLKKNMESGLIKKDSANQAKVKLVLEDGTPYPQEGALKFSDVTVDTGTGSIILRSVFPNPKMTLLPGMYVRALIEEGINENAILVPQQGVTRNSKGEATSMVVNAEGKVEVRELKIDRAVGSKWIVSEGLKAGDKVIVEGLQKARPGDLVKTIPFGEKVEAQKNQAGQVDQVDQAGSQAQKASKKPEKAATGAGK
ncbi:efflux RND transporter periplasmic adaptor subunit [Desulforegula conservatrix]|uniref:efflux RND transporter periplasmic adaptor subunit n=1 Tax=Desulforegula conservatrix TaxID=153026 RepID=UPI000410EC7D|nr:efflux RND transporter periplasmic adaptor subunit [Desulforegula conservatrix]